MSPLFSGLRDAAVVGAAILDGMTDLGLELAANDGAMCVSGIYLPLTVIVAELCW